MTAPSVERPSRRRAAGSPPATVEALDPPVVRALLQGAVEEAARLLDADGAFLYRLDESRGVLRFAYDAGVRDLSERPWVRRLELKVGAGMFGKAVAERRVMVTGDYPNDHAFVHAKGPDRIVREVEIRSMVVAPLQAAGRVYGALGTFSSQPDAFTAPQIALVRALAEHAAASLANVALIAELDRSREEVARRAEAERTLRELGTRLSAAKEPADVVQRAVDEALRLLDGDGARLDLIDPRVNLLRGAYVGGAEPPDSTLWPDDPDERLDEGVSGKAVSTGRTFRTGDYLHDTRFVHGKGPDGYVDRTAIDSAIAAPLVSDDGPFGALTVWSHRPHAFDDAHEALLETIAGQAAVALGRARLIEELGRSQGALERRVETERTLRELAQRIVEIRDPSLVLEQVIEDAARLVGGDGATIDLTGGEPDDHEGWAYDRGMSAIGRDMLVAIGVEDDAGLSGKALASGRVQITDDYLEDDALKHDEMRDRAARELGMRGAIAVPFKAGRRDGVILVWSKRAAAFGPAEADTLVALGILAGIAVSNAALIEDLGESREQLARRADQERALREIAGRLSAIDDPADVLQRIVGEMRRLLEAERCRLDLTEPVVGRWLWTDPVGMLLRDTAAIPFGRPEEAKGLTRMAIEARHAIVSGDYLADDRFDHYPEADIEARELGLTSVVVIPVIGDTGLLGVLQAAHQAKDAFRDQELRLIEALASQAAIAITNARLVDRLATSQRELARKVDAEQALREIAARITVIREPREVLQAIVDEARRLIPSDSARIDLLDPDTGVLHWEYGSGGFGEVDDEPRFRSAAMTEDEGLSGLAMRTREPQYTGRYLEDPRFPHNDDIDAYVLAAGVNSILATPLLGETDAFGALYVVARPRDAFDDRDAEILSALASQASIAITNARLVDALGQSREALEGRADAERSLREIAARLTAIREPRAVLQLIVDEARRLAGSDAAFLDLLDPATAELRFEVASPATITRPDAADPTVPSGEGIAGLAITRRASQRSGDILTDDRFHYPEAAQAITRETGIRSVVAVPLLAEGTALGTISIASRRVDAFGEADEAQLAALANQAAIAIRNAELVRELGRSREESARRADTERTLRELAARITAIRDPEAILGLIVEEARRVLGSDGAHLTRMADDRSYLRPVVVAGGLDAETRQWLMGLHFWIDGGINGLAAGQGRVVSTPDYRSDPRIPREPDDIEVAERLGLGAMAAAPLRAPGGDVIGTLAVNYRVPGRIAPERLEVLQALADHAAIAVWNSDLLQRLEESEHSYRRLVQTSPDVVWQADADGVFTFFSDDIVALLGYTPGELVGHHFGDVIAPASRSEAGSRWSQLAEDQRQLRVKLDLIRKDGSVVPAEIAAVGIYEDDVFVGGQGTVRDVSERERLERELRESEARFRNLVENSPDLVWEIDLDGRFTYVSDSAERLLGVPPTEMLGRPSNDWIDPASLSAMFRIGSVVDDPHQVVRSTLTMIHRSGERIPFDIRATGLFRGGELVGVHGASRDVSERVRLERELRESERRYRFLIENSPDVIWSLDADGRFTFITDSVERATGWTASQFIGQPFERFTDETTLPTVRAAIDSLRVDPERRHVVRIGIPRPDGTIAPTELSFVGMTDGAGRFAGIQGSSRDVSERERLEAELRESESRYRSLVQSSPDVIFAMDGEGRYTFFSDRATELTGWTPDELLGRHFGEVVDLASFPDAPDEFERFTREPGKPSTSRISLRHKDGHLTPFEVSALGQVEDGKLIAVRGVARDISERVRLERELQESEQRYRYLVQSSPDLVWVTDEQGHFTFVSDTALEILGLSPEEMLGRSFEDLAPPGTSRNALARFRWLQRHPTRVHRSQIPVLAKDGRVITMEITGVGMLEEGRFVGAHGAARDISERERLERTVRESEARYRYLVRASPDVVWEVSPEGKITFMSDRIEPLTGWQPVDVIGRDFSFLMTEESIRESASTWQAVRDDPSAVYPLAITMPTRWGESVPVEVWLTGRVEDGLFVGAHGSIRDMRERERLERDLRSQAAELASGEERAHLARELHDSVTQALFSMTLLTRSIELLLDRDPSQVPAKLVALRDLQKDALAEMRALIFELRPGNVEESGLIGALKTHTAGLAGRVGLPVVLDAELEARPPIEVEETLYRIAQEALHNTVKHAGAHQVRIEVCRVADGVRLKVVDDGRGFDPTQVPDGHLGLAGMRARAEKLGGRIAVKSTLGQGTTIEVVVPEVDVSPS